MTISTHELIFSFPSSILFYPPSSLSVLVSLAALDPAASCSKSLADSCQVGLSVFSLFVCLSLILGHFASTSFWHCCFPHITHSHATGARGHRFASMSHGLCICNPFWVWLVGVKIWSVHSAYLAKQCKVNLLSSSFGLDCQNWWFLCRQRRQDQSLYPLHMCAGVANYDNVLWVVCF